jgi:hypothetical protein
VCLSGSGQEDFKMLYHLDVTFLKLMKLFFLKKKSLPTPVKANIKHKEYRAHVV